MPIETLAGIPVKRTIFPVITGRFYVLTVNIRLLRSGGHPASDTASTRIFTGKRSLNWAYFTLEKMLSLRRRATRVRAPFLKMGMDPDSPGTGNEKAPGTSPFCVLLRTFLQTLSVLNETAHALLRSRVQTISYYFLPEP